MLLLIREHGTDRTSAVAHGSVRNAFRQIFADRDLRWLYLTSVLGGGGAAWAWSTCSCCST